MAIPLITSGGVFTRLGHIFGGMDDIQAMRGAAATARVLAAARITNRVSQLDDDYNAAPEDQNVLDGIYVTRSSFQSAQLGALSAFVTLAQNTLVEMANDDVPLPQKTVAEAMKELIKQMKGTSDDVNASTVAAGAQTSYGTPVGNPTIVVSVKGNDGVDLEYVFAEKLKFRVSGDSYVSATANNEPVAVTGEVAASTLDYLWPLGSGASQSINVVDSTANNSAGNILQNSDFETFTTTNYPDNWVITVGAVTTNVLNGGSGDAYASTTGCLRFLGDVGSTLTAITQQFNTTPSTVAGSGGTAGTLAALTQYALNCWVKVSATPAAGVLEFSLIDGSGSTINDDAGAANLFTKSLTAVSTSYVNVNGTFRLPKNPPATIKLKVRLSTAIDNTKSVYIDHMALNKMSQVYTGGPFVSIFSAATKPITGDTWTVAITNTFGLIQKKFEQVFGMRTLGLQLPSDTGAAETVADTLIA